MNSTPTPKETEPHGAPGARADERLAHAHEQIKRADEQLARLTEQVAKMERDAAHPPSAGSAPQSPSAEPDPQPPSAPPAPPPPPTKLTLRTLAALPLAACIIVAALVLQSSYGDGAKRWAPQLASTPSSAPPENPPSSAQPAPSTVQVAAVGTAPLQESSPQAAAPQAPFLAQAAPPQDAAPPTTAAPPDQTQMLQTIARDLANLERTIEQLKANQQQMASDNSKAIGELKASQEEMKRALAKVSEPGPPKMSLPPTRPAPTFRKPERPPAQARARPRYPREWMYDDYDW